MVSFYGLDNFFGGVGDMSCGIPRILTLPVSAGDIMRHGFDPWVMKIPWRRAWQPTPLLLPGESHGQRSLAGYSPWGCTKLEMSEATEYIHTYASLLVVAAKLSPFSCVRLCVTP